ncbi:MAG TPA: hypothetical protein VFV38_48565 [Ktedonobacteraceae bacterium]|nr:hypothetical protein [Ktedonobacteraceae bacterium]
MQPSSLLGVHVSKPLMGEGNNDAISRGLALHRHQASIGIDPILAEALQAISHR